MRITWASAAIMLLSAIAIVLATATSSSAINGGAAVANAAARPPHATVGGTVWRAGPVPLTEPCIATLLCENVIMTAGHCLSFNAPGDMYFTLAEDMNALPGPGNRFQRTEREFNRAGQTRTVRIDKNSVDYGEIYNVAVGGGQFIPVGLAFAKLRGTDTLPGLAYPNLVPQNFALAQDANSLNPRHADFLNPGNAATLGRVAGYGDNAALRAGAGALRKGSMRFLSWIEPTRLAPQGNVRPAANSVNGFLLQFSRGKDNEAHGCPGDSGGPVFLAEILRTDLVEFLELISDSACTNPGLPHPTVAGATTPHFNNYVSLIYTANRTKLRDFMNNNCSDRRTIDMKTGDNVVRPGDDEEQTSNEEDWTCTPPSQDISPAVYPEDYYAFLQGWLDVMSTVFPDFPWYQVDSADPALLPTPAPVYCSTPVPYPTDTPVPTASPLPTDSPLPTVTALPTVTPFPTVTPLPTVPPQPTVSPLPTVTDAPTPVATVSSTPMQTLTMPPMPTVTDAFVW